MFNVLKQYPLVAFYNDGDQDRTQFIQGVELNGLNYLGLATVPYGSNGLPITDRQPSADAISDTTPRALDTICYPYLYDPTDDTWDRQRPNHSLTALASAARTATVNSSDLTNYNARGLHCIIDVSAYPAAASVVPHIQAYDPLSTSYYDILVGNAIVATGTTILKIYPGITESANASASDIVPRTFRVRMVHADADSITYSVGIQLVL